MPCARYSRQSWSASWREGSRDRVGASGGDAGSGPENRSKFGPIESPLPVAQEK